MITLQDFHPVIPTRVEGARPVRPLGDEQRPDFQRKPGESITRTVERFFRENADEVWNSTDIALVLNLNPKAVCQSLTLLRRAGKIKLIDKMAVPNGGPHISNYGWDGDA
jgi:hypothetical protein